MRINLHAALLVAVTAFVTLGPSGRSFSDFRGKEGRRPGSFCICPGCCLMRLWECWWFTACET